MRGAPSQSRSTTILAILVAVALPDAVTTRAAALPKRPMRDAAHMPGPWPARAVKLPADPGIANATCVECHADVAEEWRASLHAQAYSNSAFRRALAIEPLPFCRGCHAPEASPLGDGANALRELGVACVTCHIVDGAILAAPGEHTQQPHPVLRSPAFATVEACAKCHEFPFPGESAASGVELMQSTVSEHRASDYAQVACATCHMPRLIGGRRSHRFDVTRNAPLLQAAIHVEARRLNAGEIELILTSRGVGHAFPTGDLFRRIHVHAEAVGPEYSSIASADAYLTRTFVTTRSVAGMRRRLSTSDTRLAVGGAQMQHILLDLTAAAAQLSILYSVTYERVEHPGKVGQPDAVLEGSLDLTAGILPSQF